MTFQINDRPAPSTEERNALFHLIVEPHMGLVRRLVRHHTFAGEDADDNLQDVLLHLLHAVGYYDPDYGVSVPTWISRVVVHKMTDLHRRQRSDATFVPADSDEAVRLAAPPTAAVPLTVDPDDYPRTYPALCRLTALQRRALLLTAEGWSIADLAAELRITPVAARALLCRARRAMVGHYSPFSINSNHATTY